MKNSRNLSKFIVAIAQLLLLGACGSSAATQSNFSGSSADRTVPRDADKAQKELSDKLTKQEGVTFALKQDLETLRQDFDYFKIVPSTSSYVIIPLGGIIVYELAEGTISEQRNVVDPTIVGSA